MTSTPVAPPFLTDGGEVGHLLRGGATRASALGEPAGWPLPLRTLAGVMLTAAAPMFVAWGPQRALLYNDAYAPILGARHPMALGRSFYEVWHEVEAELRPILEGAFAGKSTSMDDIELVLRRNGPAETAHFSFFYTPVWDEAGAIAGVYCACNEITQKVAEQRRLSEALEAKVVEHDTMWRLSKDLLAVVGPDGLFRAVNPAWRALLGFEPEELVGRPVGDFLHPDDVERMLRHVLAEVQLEPFINRYRHRDGSYRWIAWTAAPQCGAVYAVGRDITLERQAAQQLERMQAGLRQAQKMDALGQLTGGIAHDFNNLLQALRNQFELLRRHPDNALRVAERAAGGLRVVERGAKLTAQLLTFSRVQQLERKPVDVQRLLAGMTELLGRTLGPSIAIDLHLGDAADSAVADATQLEMALLNLAINARDAMPTGGRLTLATALRQIDHDAELTPGEYIEISVADQGIGMSPEVQERAFEPFFTTKGAGKGTGLGLPQVYGFTRSVGGSARIETAPGRGTRVALLLHRAAAAPAAVDAAAGGSTDATASATVLLIDDDHDVRGVLADCLRSSGYEVCEAADGRSGLAALERQRPDVVVLDYAMPGMTGAEVARAARDRHPELPIIFASGYADSAELQAALGPDAVTLRKPFELSELIAAIERVVVA